MKTLPFQFTYDQFRFCQLAPQGDVALFEKSKPAHSRRSYEVVIVQQHPAQTIHGRDYPERESMPRSEDWGASGWTCMDPKSAQAKFARLVGAHAKATFTPAPFPAGASESAARLKTADSSPMPPRETPVLPPGSAPT